MKAPCGSRFDRERNDNPARPPGTTSSTSPERSSWPKVGASSQPSSGSDSTVCSGMLDSPRLRRLRETNGFFTRLAHACRTGEHPYRLARWWGERTCAIRWQGLVRPDGLGRLDGPEGSVTFALELDRGTESRDRLAESFNTGGVAPYGYRKVYLTQHPSKTMG
jgi:hypothetical protein